MIQFASSRLEHSLRWGLVTSTIWCGGPSVAQQRETVTAETARATLERLDANPQVRRMFATCPADTFRRARAESRIRPAVPSSAQCAANPASCYGGCMTGSGSACFNLARAFQAADKVVPQRYSEMLFSMACGFGDAGGCTNRASGIRNTSFEGDPFQNVAEKAQEACQFRTFRLACRQSDAWGCAMLGQSYQRGEGVASSASFARGAFGTSCRLSPDFEACTFAKEAMQEMEDHRSRR